MQLLNAANLVTLTRIAGVCYLFTLVPFVHESQQLLALGVFVFVALTDALDGWLARKLNQVSELGKVLDPLADKCLLLILLPLLSMKAIGAFPVFLILTREFAIMAVRVLAAKKKMNIAASVAGKIKTGVTLPICALLMARPAVEGIQEVTWVLWPLVTLKRWVFLWPEWVFASLIWLMVTAAIVSFLDYLRVFIWESNLQAANQDRQQAKRAMLTIIPNTVTLANFLAGVWAVLLAVSGQLKLAAACILIGMMLDAIDGRLARKLNAFSRFGESIDTKADYMTFGIAPAVLLFCFLYPSFSGWFMGFPILFAGSYLVAVVYRLRRFSKDGHHAFFAGIPSPIGAMFLVVSLYSLITPFFWVFVVVNILNIALMVSVFPYPHNEAAYTKRFFVKLKVPILIGIIGVIMRYLGVAWIGDLFNTMVLGLMLVYYAAPLLPDSSS